MKKSLEQEKKHTMLIDEVRMLREENARLRSIQNLDLIFSDWSDRVRTDSVFNGSVWCMFSDLCDVFNGSADVVRPLIENLLLARIEIKRLQDLFDDLYKEKK
jgi:hypothetical protein